MGRTSRTQNTQSNKATSNKNNKHHNHAQNVRSSQRARSEAAQPAAGHSRARSRDRLRARDANSMQASLFSVAPSLVTTVRTSSSAVMLPAIVPQPNLSASNTPLQLSNEHFFNADSQQQQQQQPQQQPPQQQQQHQHSGHRGQQQQQQQQQGGEPSQTNGAMPSSRSIASSSFSSRNPSSSSRRSPWPQNPSVLVSVDPSHEPDIISNGIIQEHRSHRHHPQHQHHAITCHRVGSSDHRAKPLIGPRGGAPTSSLSINTQCSRFLPEDFSFISPCVKYSLFFFNLVFWLIGAGFMALGSWSLLEENEYDIIRLRNLFDYLLPISVSLFILGLVVFAMSFAGCLGALRENLCLLRLYSIILLVLFVLEVLISMFGFLFPDAFVNFVKNRLSKDLIVNYREDSNLQNLIDVIQMEFHCCGISDHGYMDWSNNMYFHCDLSNPSSERCAVPFSCCRNLNTELINIMCGYNMQNHSSVVEINNHVYTRGCIGAISEMFENNLNIVVSVCLVSALTQLLVMFLARSLQSQINAQRARWM